MSRERQRANKRKGVIEKALEKKNIYGYNDPTAYEAVKNIIDSERKAVKQHSRSI